MLVKCMGLSHLQALLVTSPETARTIGRPTSRRTTHHRHKYKQCLQLTRVFTMADWKAALVEAVQAQATANTESEDTAFHLALREEERRLSIEI